MVLRIEDVHLQYGSSVRAVQGCSLDVGEGELVSLIGQNGAGKSTLVKAIMGEVPVASGSITVDGTSVASKSYSTIRAGVSHVPESRGIFASLTVGENLRLGAVTRKDKAEVGTDIDRWFTVFPRLAERRDQVAGTLSGGEQQMLAVARAMMSRPRLLLCDEISLGLAPVVVQELFVTLAEVNRELGTALLLVEQNAELALEIASRVYLLEVGEVSASGSAESFRDDNSIRAAYLGY